MSPGAAACGADRPRPSLRVRGASWRGAVACATVLAFGGCGWHPVYRASTASGGPVAAALGRVDVAIIGERQGQLLRQALQARLQGDGDDQTPQYLLQTGYSISQEGIGITSDSAVTRIRLIGTATFVLVSIQSDPRTCLSGTARDVDGTDVQIDQFFASDLQTETVERRLANAVADQIVSRLALAFGKPGGLACEVR